MGIKLPDLIVERTIRDGIEYIRENPDVVDDIFADLLLGYAASKYGATELTRIKEVIFSEKNIAVVHSFHEAEAKTPCYSIQLGNESEMKARAHLSDFEADVQTAITDSEALLALRRVTDLIPTSYDPLTGIVTVSDSVDLSNVYDKFIYSDGDGTEFVIQQGMSNDNGNKFFMILPNLTPNIADPGYVRTFLNYTQNEQKGYESDVNMLVGCHSKDALFTKYLYVILKYIMASRKRDLIQCSFICSSFSGSDFTKDLHYEGDQIFTRFFTLTGQVEDSWTSDPVQLIDSVVVDAVPIDFDGTEVEGGSLDDDSDDDDL